MNANDNKNSSFDHNSASSFKNMSKGRTKFYVYILITNVKDCYQVLMLKFLMHLIVSQVKAQNIETSSCSSLHFKLIESRSQLEKQRNIFDLFSRYAAITVQMLDDGKRCIRSACYFQCLYFKLYYKQLCNQLFSICIHIILFSQFIYRNITRVQRNKRSGYCTKRLV